ncbi:hypothetical protein HanRHA438_Chr14g0653961 [Helianthus annuus]|nr:hypothetical protein HanRHA438_Chr14g0653961 [Helianthus annuus]
MKGMILTRKKHSCIVRFFYNLHRPNNTYPFSRLHFLAMIQPCPLKELSLPERSIPSSKAQPFAHRKPSSVVRTLKDTKEPKERLYTCLQK